ncbi:hypothetical protein [Pseudoalteromonas sp. MTN2-4]|uniref:hypothetical protein n=1 Tax=Pseudoalteromonas sp. MTN2-4 TaxID=3056555 RepID=UPI0036F3EAB2
MVNSTDLINFNNGNKRKWQLNTVLKLLGLEQTTLLDLLSSNNHSNDFTQKRSIYIRKRLWVMCIFFVISVPFFSIYDFNAFEYEQATTILMSGFVL